VGPLLRRQLVTVAGPQHPGPHGPCRAVERGRVLKLVAGGALALLLVACGSQPSAVEQVARQRSAQAAQAARDAQLPKDVQDFLARAAGAAGHRYTVTYAGPGNGK